MSPQGLSSTRRFFLLAAVVGCLAMAILCVVPTFFGPDKATEWFVSPFGATVWWALGLLIVVSMIAVQALHRRLGLLAMHLGLVLVIAGALWGSPTMHRLRARLWDNPRQYKGFMGIDEGGSSNQLLDGNFQPIAKLPFEVHLEEFTLEYYPKDDNELWVFIVDAIAPGNPRGMGQVWQSMAFKWKPEKTVRLPFCDIDLLVTEYQRVQYGAGAPVLPEAKLTLTRKGQSREEFFKPQPMMPAIRLPLAGLYDSARAWHDAGAPTLRFRPPAPIIKDFKSALVVYRDGKEIARKTIEVNDPLYVDGYHLYQHDYDHVEGRYTILSVASDSGLSLVYAGFILLVGGLAWHVLLPKRKARKAGA
jgi:hypothetical protein